MRPQSVTPACADEREVGPDDPAILPHVIADQCDMSRLALLQSMNQRLPRRVV